MIKSQPSIFIFIFFVGTRKANKRYRVQQNQKERVIGKKETTKQMVNQQQNPEVTKPAYEPNQRQSSDMQTSAYFKLRALAAQLRPHFMQVKKYISFSRTCCISSFSSLFISQMWLIGRFHIRFQEKIKENRLLKHLGYEKFEYVVVVVFGAFDWCWISVAHRCD